MTTSDMVALAATDAARVSARSADRAAIVPTRQPRTRAGAPLRPTMAAAVAANAASRIRRALHPERTTVHHVCVDHLMWTTTYCKMIYTHVVKELRTPARSLLDILQMRVEP